MISFKTYLIGSLFCFLMLTQLTIISFAPALSELSNTMMIDLEDSAEKEEGEKGKEIKPKINFQLIDVSKRLAYHNQLSLLGLTYEISLNVKLIPLEIVTPPPESMV
jgi:hypothetical protein